MDAVTAMVLLAWCISIAGAAELCLAIDRRHQREMRRERFGLPPGKDPWP